MRAILHGLDGNRLADRAGDDNHRDIEFRLLDRGKCCLRAETGQVVVSDNDIPGVVRQRRLEVSTGIDALKIRSVTTLAQLAHKQRGVVFGVLDQQDAQQRRHVFSPGAAAVR